MTDFRDESDVEPGVRTRAANRRIPAPSSFSVPPDTPAPEIAPYGYPPPPDIPPYGYATAPPRTGIPIGEVLLAVVLPLASCSLAAWVYFVIAAVRHRDKRQYIAAAVYAALFVIGLVAVLVDPSAPEADDLTVAQGTGLWIFALTGFVAAFHGAVLATHAASSNRGH